MIPFFRKTRKKMADDNRPIQYMRYAIGEILLVVIGILIALQINNWNEARKNKNEEIAILENLDENLILAKKQSETLISTEKELKKTLLLVLGIDSKNSEINRGSISDSIFKGALWDLESDIPVINAYTDLKNTNKLGLINNLKLKEKFTSLEVNLNKLKNMLEDRLNVQQIRIDNVAENDVNFIPYIKSVIPTINIENEIKNDYKQILDSQRIRNLFGIKLSMTQDVLTYRENLDKEIKDLILLIESELNEQN